MHKSLDFLRTPKNISKKNIIFLDIDGVLQPYSAATRFDYQLEKLPQYFANKYNDKSFLQCDIYDLGAVYFDWNEVAVAILKEILRMFSAYLVIHSGWRESMSKDTLKTLFKLYDMNDYILDVLPSGKKETVIEKYLSENKDFIENFIVIDDDNMLSSFGMHFCHTYNVMDISDELYINHFLSFDYSLNYNTLEFSKSHKTKALLLEKNHNIENKKMSVFSIKDNTLLTRYEILMIFNELHKYCKIHNIWCMGFVLPTEFSDLSTIYRDTKCIEKEHSKILLCSPTHNFSDERLMKEKIDEIYQILK